MDGKPILNVKSLKEQVYEYLRDQMRHGGILPGSAIDMEETSKKLGVSKTPLRDALLQLEMEDFVTILPRRAVVVNELTLDEVRNYYDLIGALEAKALGMSFSRLGSDEIERLERLVEGMEKALASDNFDLYYDRNLRFHDAYLKPCGNPALIKVVNTLKKRLYDFPRQSRFVKEWELASIKEHRELLRLIREGRRDEAMRFVEDVHWSFAIQERFIVKYYPAGPAAEPARSGSGR